MTHSLPPSIKRDDYAEKIGRQDMIEIRVIDCEWPSHKAAMRISHNDHKNYYETVQQAVDKRIYDREDFIDDDERYGNMTLTSKPRPADFTKDFEMTELPDFVIEMGIACASTLSKALFAANWIMNKDGSSVRAVDKASEGSAE